MNILFKIFCYAYLFLLSCFFSCLYSAKPRKSTRVKVMINRLVKTKKKEVKEEPQNITIKLNKSDTYTDFKAKILAQSNTSFFKKFGHYQVTIFSSPPNRSNIIKAGYYNWMRNNKKIGKQKKLRKMVEINRGDQFYAIIREKDDKKSKYITVFLDYEYSNRVIMLRIPKFETNLIDYEPSILALAQKRFKGVLKEEQNNEGLEHLSKANTLIYPPELKGLVKSENLGQPHQFLQNGDRISLRVNQPTPITLIIKVIDEYEVIDETVTKKIERVFNGNSYVDDVVKYLRSNFYWDIENELMSQGIYDNKVGYGFLKADWRLERLSSNTQRSMTFYVEKNNTDSYMGMKRSFLDKLQNHKRIGLVINKHATSDTTERQNPQVIDLEDFPLDKMKISDLKKKIKETLIKGTESNVKNLYQSYWKIGRRMMLYIGKPNGVLKSINMQSKQSTLANLGIHANDIVFTIITSEKNPHQVSFFVQDEGSKSIVLITENLATTKRSSTQNQLRGIRLKAIQALRSLNNVSESSLPIWDPNIVDKTDLGQGENIWNLKNGDIIRMKLKEEYQTATVKLGDPPVNFYIAIPLNGHFQDILEETKKQMNWKDNGIEKGVFIASKGQFIELVLQDRVDGKGPFYVRNKIIQNDEQKSSIEAPTINHKSDEDQHSTGSDLKEHQEKKGNDGFISQQSSHSVYPKIESENQENPALGLQQSAITSHNDIVTQSQKNSELTSQSTHTTYSKTENKNLIREQVSPIVNDSSKKSQINHGDHATSQEMMTAQDQSQDKKNHPLNAGEKVLESLPKQRENENRSLGVVGLVGVVGILGALATTNWYSRRSKSSKVQ